MTQKRKKVAVYTWVTPTNSKWLNATSKKTLKTKSQLVDDLIEKARLAHKEKTTTTRHAHVK